MAVLRRLLLGTTKTWYTAMDAATSDTLNPKPQSLQRCFYHGIYQVSIIFRISTKLWRLGRRARKERCRLEDLIKSKGMQYGSYPQFTVAVKGQKGKVDSQLSNGDTGTNCAS